MQYHKFEGDREIFSDKKVPEQSLFVTSLGRWVSKPTAEQIAAEGWLPYTPPYVPSVTPALAEVMEAVKKILSTDTEELSDEDALAVAALYPTWVSKLPEDPLNPKPVYATLPVGERLWYDGKLYKVLQPHIPQRDWTPDATPALYTEVSIEEWPPFVQPTSAETAYNTGDKVTFEGEHYICQIDNCTWSPSDYPAAWQIQI